MEFLIKFADHFIFKLSNQTIKLKNNSPEIEKYKDQIAEILSKRYRQELGYQIDVNLSSIPLDEVILTIDDNDKVISISGIEKDDNTRRVKMFAIRDTSGQESLYQAKQNQSAIFDQLTSTFSSPDTFAEISFDLYEKLIRLLKLYEKKNKHSLLKLYFFTGESAARLIPGRKLLVNEDGVKYQKKVHGAGVIADKIIIGNSQNISGEIGYESYAEASSHSNYHGKLITSGYDKNITVLKFDPSKWA